MVSKRVSDIETSVIHEMSRLAGMVDDPAMLSWAKPTTGTPGHIDEGAIEAIQKGLTSGYSTSQGLPVLREAIVEKLKRDNNIEADVSEIIVTVGAIEGLSAAVMALVDPGDEVLTPSPNYSTHIQQIQLANGVPVFVRTIEEENFRLDLESFKQAITPRTKAFLFCSPCNPTGAVFDEDTLRAVADICMERDITVITDESYEYFVFDGNRHFSIASIPGMKEHSVSTFTFTKTYAMTGWRIGYMVAGKEMIPQLQKVHIPFAICAPVASQYAALAALKGSQDCIAEFGEHYLRARNLVCERLDRVPHVFSYQRPQGSYCMFPKIEIEGENDSLAFCKKLLLEGRVSTTPGVAFGPSGEGHLRITFCCPEETINKAFDRIEEFYPG
jgi:aminotransferase